MTETSIIMQLASQFGPTGLIIGYLVWNRLTVEKDRQKIDQERIEADKDLSASLATLTTVITQMRERP